jgi:hypothetical protein
MNHNQSKKSKQGNSHPSNKLKPSQLLRLEKQVLQDIQMANRTSRSGSKKRGSVVLRSAGFKPAQSSASKGRDLGERYNRKFDCISSPEKLNYRVEDFDELIGAVFSSVAFKTTSYPANPGMPVTFPWLQQITTLFEKYEFEALEFYFLHEVSQFNAAGAAGLVIMSFLYDAASAAPTTKQQIEAGQPNVVCMPNQNSLLKINCMRAFPKKVPLYVRSLPPPGATDIKTYDCGNVFITTQGMASDGVEVGELHVRGKVRLYDRVLDSSAIVAPMNNTVTMLTATMGVPQVANSSQNFPVALPVTVTNGLDVGIIAVPDIGPAAVTLSGGNYNLDTFINVAAPTGAVFTSGSMQLWENNVPIAEAVLPAGSAVSQWTPSLNWWLGVVNKASNAFFPNQYQIISNMVTSTAAAYDILDSVFRVTAA